MCVMCVWWDEGAVPQTRRCGQLGVPLPSSGTAPRSASSPGGESLDRAPNAGAVAARASSPGPNARIFVARPPRSIAPSPSPAAGKGHPRTDGGGAARGTLARALWRPSHPSLPPAGAFAPGRVRAPLPALLLCFVSFLPPLFKTTLSLYFLLALRFSPVPPHSFSFSRSLSLFVSLCLCVSVSLTPTFSPHYPGDPTPSALPADNSWVHTPTPGEAVWPGPLLLGACRVTGESPTVTTVGLAWGGGSFPGCTGEGAAATPAAGTIAAAGIGLITSLRTGASGARWSGLRLTLGAGEQQGGREGLDCPHPGRGWKEGGTGL